MTSKWKYILALILAACTLESCIMTEIVDEVNEVTEKSGGNLASKANKVLKGGFSILLVNAANNTCLEVDSLQICNILVEDSVTGSITRGKKTLEIASEDTLIEFGNQASTSTETIPVQTFTPWTPVTLPQNSNNTYLKIYGKIYTYLADCTLLLLAEGPLYAPLTGKITPDSLTITKFELADNCPLYYETEGQMNKALNAINFEVTVNDWQEH